MTRLIALYPRAWRDRFEDEFLAPLQERSPEPLDRLDIVRGAIDARLHPELSGAPQPGRPRSRAVVLTGILIAIGGLGWSAWLGLLLRSFDGWGTGTPESADLIVVLSVLGFISLTVAIVAIGVTFGSSMRPAGMPAASLAGVGFALGAIGAGLAVLLGFVGVGVLAWSLSGRVIPRWLATSWIGSCALVSWAFVAFVAGGGQDVRLIGLGAPFGIVWLVVGAVIAVGRSPVPVGTPPGIA
jgi:hypothetical protein